MKVYIDTRENNRVKVGLGDEVVEREGRAQEVLAIIDELLTKQGKTVKDISGVEVEEGPGSFTGLRVGVAVANALGWSLGVPVNGRDVAEEGGVEPKYGSALRLRNKQGTEYEKRETPSFAKASAGQAKRKTGDEKRETPVFGRIRLDLVV